MLRIFQKWARVKDVFISKRPNRWGRRFGFVSFFPVPNEARLEKQLDQIYIGNLKLYVNLPKYRRSEVEFSKEKPKVRQSDYSHGNDPGGRSKGKEVWREIFFVTGQAVRRGPSLKQSYADAVRVSERGDWKGPVFVTKSNTPPWLVRSAVGWMSPDLTFDSLKDEFVKGGMNTIKLRFLGDNLILLTPKEGERMEDLFELNKEWFLSLFGSIEPWSAKYVVDHKIVWVRCFGVPITLWNKDCFSRVVGEVASLVDIDENTLSWENLEYARLLVRLPRSQKAEMAKGFRINGQVYNISLVEEILSLRSGDCSCLEYHLGSSDSISSSETVVEGTFSEGSSGEEGADRNQCNRRWGVVPEEVGQSQLKQETKWKQFDKKARSDMGCQNKSGFLSLNEGKRVRGESEGGAALAVTSIANAAVIEGKQVIGESEGGAALSVPSQVNAACTVIQQCLVNLLEGVQSAIPLGPKQGEAQLESQGAFSKEEDEGGPVSFWKEESERKLGYEEGVGVLALSPPPHLCSTSKMSGRVALSAVEPVQEKDSGLSPCHATHHFSEGQDSSSGSSDPQPSVSTNRRREGCGMGTTNGNKASTHTEGVSKTSSEFRRLMESKIAQPKWRTNGGIGSLHGVSSSSRLSRCSFAESINDINLCNSRIKSKEQAAESVRIWDLGQNLGLQCSGDAEGVVGELGRLEVRDNEVNNKSKGGRKKVGP